MAAAGPGAPVGPGRLACASCVRTALDRSFLAIDPSLICLPVISLAAVADPAVARTSPSTNAANIPVRPSRRFRGNGAPCLLRRRLRTAYSADRQNRRADGLARDHLR